VLDHQAAATTAALADACRECDGARAARQAERLIGWGEGLTPAGDDFVVGVCAGLDGLIDACDARQLACRAALAAAIRASAPRTTTISAHLLRLAADGHHHERLLAARDALLRDVAQPSADRALLAACAVGATSGTDAVAGLLAALAAWLPAPTAMAAH